MKQDPERQDQLISVLGLRKNFQQLVIGQEVETSEAIPQKHEPFNFYMTSLLQGSMEQSAC